MNYQEWILNNVPSLQAPLFFGALAFFFAIQLMVPRRLPNFSQARRRLNNVYITALAVVCLGFVPVSFFVTANWAHQNNLGLLNNLNISIWIVVLITFLGRALISYVTHMLHHKIPWLWRMHRVHHNDTELDITTTFRVHPLELFISPLIGLPIVVLLGLSPWVLVVYEVFDE